MQSERETRSRSFDPPAAVLTIEQAILVNAARMRTEQLAARYRTREEAWSAEARKGESMRDRMDRTVSQPPSAAYLAMASNMGQRPGTSTGFRAFSEAMRRNP